MAEKITKELIFDLADQLIAQGTEPTNLKLREMNDHRGSLSSITPHLKAWREQRSAEAVESLPDMPEERLLSVLRPVWAELVRESQTMLKIERALFEGDRDVFMADAGNYIAEIDRQADEIELLTAELAQSQQLTQQQSMELSTLTERADQQARRIDNLQQDKLAADKVAQDLRSELAVEHKNGEQLQDQLTASSKQNNELTGDLKVSREQNSSMAVQLKTSQESVIDTKQQLTHEKQRYEELRLQHNDQARVVVTTETKLEMVSKQLELSQAEVKKVTADLGHANSRADRLEGNLIAMNESLQQKTESKSKENQLNLLDKDKKQ